MTLRLQPRCAAKFSTPALMAFGQESSEFSSRAGGRILAERIPMAQC